MGTEAKNEILNLQPTIDHYEALLNQQYEVIRAMEKEQGKALERIKKKEATIEGLRMIIKRKGNAEKAADHIANRNLENFNKLHGEQLHLIKSLQTALDLKALVYDDLKKEAADHRDLCAKTIRHDYERISSLFGGLTNAISCMVEAGVSVERIKAFEAVREGDPAEGIVIKYEEVIREQEATIERLNNSLGRHEEIVMSVTDKAATQVGELQDRVSRLEAALIDALSCFGEKDVIATRERIEAWEAAVEVK